MNYSYSFFTAFNFYPPNRLSDEKMPTGYETGELNNKALTL